MYFVLDPSASEEELRAADRFEKAVNQEGSDYLPVQAIIGGDEDNPGHQRRVDQPQNFEAVDVRNPDVQEGKIRPVFHDLDDGTLPIGAFVENFKIRILVKQLTNTLSGQKFIIDDQDADLLVGCN
jgi:hypothetical protein